MNPVRSWRRVFVALASLALVVKILIPAGYMAAPATNDLPFALVLCTVDGMISVAPGEALPHGGDDEPDSAADDSPCAFAGHGAVAAPPVVARLDAAPLEAYALAAPVAAVSVAPGRGIAAPPPPARGPPSLLI